MAVSTRTSRTHRHVLKEDLNLPMEQQTVFILKTLSAEAKSRIFDNAFSAEIVGEDGVATASLGSALLNACRYGIESWENLIDVESPSKCIECRKMRRHGCEVLTNASLDAIADFLFELGSEVLRLNGISEADLGNSASSPPSPSGGSTQQATTASG